MSQNIINTGQAANDGTGEPLRQAFTDINNNFSQIWSSGPVNSNVQITNNKIATLQTNQNLILAPNGIGAVQANTNIIPNTDHLRDLGSNTNRWDTMWGYNVNTQSLSVSGSATITGDLTVSGNIIEMGNIVTDTKTIQLSNTASNANSANGSGLTVGANDDIATLLYSSSSNTWTTNIGISTGNIIIQGDDIYDLVGPRISNGDLSHGATAGLDISTNGSSNATVLFNTYGNIQLQTSSTGANVYNYEFGANGNVSFPGNIGANGNIQGQYFLGNGRYLVGLPDGYNNQDAANFLANLGTNAVSTLGNVTAGYFFGNGSQLTGINKIINGTSNVDIPVANGNVTITTNSTYTWKFEDTGTLVFPASPTNIYGGLDNDFTINTANSSAATYTFTFSQFGDLTVPVNLYVIENLYADNIVGPGNGNITVTANTESWLFETDGRLFLPNSGVINASGNSVDIGSEDAISLEANTVVNIYTDTNGAGHQWQFGDAGELTLPASSEILEVANPGGFPGYALALVPDPNNAIDADQQLLVYPTGGADANHLHITSGNLYNTELFLGNDNLYVKLANTGNVVINSNDGVGNTGQWTFDSTGNLTIPGTMIVTGGIVGSGASPAPTLSGFDSLSAVSASLSGNVTADYFIGDGSQLINLPAPAVTQDISSTGAMSIMLYDGAIKYNNYATVEPSSGNITGGNVLTSGLISASGNITGNYILGNGSQLTGLPATYGNSNVATFLDAYGSNTISTTGTITSGNILSSGYARLSGTFDESQASTAGLYLGYAGGTPRMMFGTGNTQQTLEIDNDGGTLRFYKPGTTLASLTNSGVFSAAGNITGANILANSNLSVVGNIIANNFTGYGNIIFNQTLSTQGGSDMSLIPGTGLVRSLGNLRPYFANTYDLGGSTTRWNNIYANVNNSITETVTGNITGGNVLTGGLVSATGNVTGGNIRTTGLISATGSITTGSNVSAVDISLSGGAWTNYTPTWQAFNIAPNIGNGTLTGRYKQLGKTVQVFISFTAGSTTTFGDGFWVFSLPVTARSTNNVILTGQFTDSGSYYEGVATNLVYPVNNAVSPYYNGAPVTALAPTTWTSGAVLVFSGTYEAA